MSGLDCDFVIKMIDHIIDQTLNVTDTKLILDHVCNCQECFEAYEFRFQQRLGESFNLAKERVYLEMREESVSDSKYSAAYKDSYTGYCTTDCYFMLEDVLIYEKLVKEIQDVPFFKFQLKKYCQYLDHLEQCYELEVKDA